MLKVLASETGDRAAALKVMKKIMRRYGRAKAITSDGLRSYKAGMKDLGKPSTV